MVLGLAACSDDLEFKSGSVIATDGTVELTFSVPELEKVATRAEIGDELSTVSVLIFKSGEDNSTLSQVEYFKKSDTSLKDDNSISFKLDKDLRGESGLQFYFIANYDGTFEKGVTTIASLKELIAYNAVSEDGKIVMSAKSDLKTLISKDVTLIRNVAYITVTGCTDINDNLEIDESVKYPFCMYGDAVLGSLLAGTETILGAPSSISSFDDDLSDSNGKYLRPTDNKNNEKKKAFIIVKAEYNSKSYFYRLDFNIKSEDGESVNILDINPNHWYQVMIKGVNGPGYATPEEASKNPSPYLEYKIHDHSPAIFNMISDGIRELGVTHEIVYSNGVSVDSDTDTWRYLYVKLYSKADEAEEAVKNLTITSDSEWLSVGEREEVNDSEMLEIEDGGSIPVVGGSGDSDDCNNKGTVYKCPVKFNKTSDLGTLQGEITVTWMGLTRTVPVTWKREFKGTDLCKVTLTIYDADKNQQFKTEQYWDFLAGNPVEDGVSLFGTDEKANNGKVRNQGLHFPVMYGEPGKTVDSKAEARWYYEYTITFTEASLTSAEYDWALNVTGDNTIKQYVKIEGVSSGTHASEGGSWSVTITRPGNALGTDGSDGNADNDYTYGVGSLELTITPNGETVNNRLSSKYTIDLYHTGFFHKSSEIHRVDADKDSQNYYYYEVVPIMGATRMRYWLDRNLGAKSAELYIESSDGSAYYGNKEAAGGYYKVAKYLENEHKDPEMYDTSEDQKDRVSPPGYRVPKQKVWNALRNSPNFDTNSVGSYYNACYRSSVGNVYFPKARYKENNSDNGESRAGYYWTQTASSGTEKQEIGRWLKSLCISGNASSYINGNVQTYAMSVRCINDIDDSGDLHRTSFNVSGATHVYLYTENKDGTRVAVTNWPGKYIGDYNTMKNGWFNFSYESDNIPAEDFYVIFNYLDKDGKIHTFSKGSNNTTSVSTDISVNDATGWRVVGDVDGNLRESGTDEDIVGIPTATEYWWKCNVESKTVYCYASFVPRYRIYWPIEKGNQLSIYTSDKSFDSEVQNGNVSGVRGYYRLEVEIPSSEKDKIINIWNTNYGDKQLGTLIRVFNEMDDHKVRCAYIDKNGNVYSGKPEGMTDQKFFVGEKLRFRWKKSAADKIHVWQVDASAFTTWPGNRNGEDGEYYYLDVTVSMLCSEIGYIRTNNGQKQDGEGVMCNFNKFVYDSSLDRYVLTIN